MEIEKVLVDRSLRHEIVSVFKVLDLVELELTAREFALLTYLMSSPGRAYTRAQICEQVWNYHFDPGTNLVDVYVQRLRRKLEDNDASFIETVRGVGYRVHSEASDREPAP